MFGLRQHAHLAAEQHLARVARDHVAAGMVGPRCAVDALNVLALVEGKKVADLERADNVVLAIDQCDGLADFQRRGQCLVHRKRNRNGPGILGTVLDDVFLVQNAVKRGSVHRPGKRAEAAIAEAVAAAFGGLAVDVVPDSSAHDGVLRDLHEGAVFGRLGNFRGDDQPGDKYGCSEDFRSN